MATLHVVGNDGRVYDVPLSDCDVTTIGRSKENIVVLHDNTTSRNHAKIAKTRKGFLLTDLGSFNGTKVNGRPVQSSILRHGDEVQIGSSKLTFMAAASEMHSVTDSVVLAPDSDPEASKQKVVGSSPQADAAQSQQLLVFADSAAEIKEKSSSSVELPGSRSGISDVSSLERTNKVLFVLYEISRQLNSITDFNQLLTKIMDLVFMVIDADYGFLLLTGEQGEDDLQPVVVKYKDERMKGKEQLKASKTIIKKVISDKVALLTSNAMDDSRLDYAKSVFMQQIRSAICVPLWKKDQIIGVIQLDSVHFENQFTQDDLELLKAIGSQMAMVIEQASLNEQIREEEAIRRRLERFHSPQVIEMIMHSGQEALDSLMDAKDVTATILFTDIIGFTGLSEKLPPREINMILNQYFSRMSDIIFRFDGTLDKYIGDGLMAVFGAPMQKDDDAERAICAAQEMRKALVKLRDRFEPTLTINIRIGINTGRVVAGNIGSPKRLEYTVIGDPVNTASRLESIAEPNQILIGEETYQQVKDVFNIKKVGSRKVKGKSQEIMVYEVA